MKPVHTHYDNLKVARSAPPEVIRAAYKSLCQKYHPDRNPDNAEAANIMALINQAYEVLSDPEKRRQHDLWIKEQEESPGTSNASRTSQAEGSQATEIPLPVAGTCKLNDLPEDSRKEIIKLATSKAPHQLRIKLEGVFWKYFWASLCLGWYFYLFAGAIDKRWEDSEQYWFMGITIVAAIALTVNAEWIYKWHTTPLHSFLFTTPLYVIKTHFDKIWFWPIWSITDIKATHNYRNGLYQDTSLAIHFDGKQESFTISPESAYKALLDSLKTLDSRFRVAFQQNDVAYFVANDYFLNYRIAPPKTSFPGNKRKKLFIYASVLLVSLITYFVAATINNHRFGGTYQATAYVPSSPYIPPQSPRNSGYGNSGYVRPATAPNGEQWPFVAGYIRGFKRLHTDGLSTVTIDNSQNDSDVFVKLVSLTGVKSYPVRVFYIPSHRQFTVNSVRAGNYDVRYRDLNTGAISRSESFELKEIPAGNDIQYSNITMTLYKIRNGNMHTYDISESEF
jgi:hypothetical protein